MNAYTTPPSPPLLMIDFTDEATGKKIQVEGDSFDALDLASLIQALNAPGQPVSFPLTLRNSKLQTDIPELLENPNWTVNVRVNSQFTNEIIALVPGGWMTAAMAPPDAILMVDQNAFSIFDKHLRSENKANLPPDFLLMMQERPILFSPLLYMLEGQLGRPSETIEELEQSYDRFATRIASLFPKSQTVPSKELSAPGAFAILKQRNERFRRDCEFLVEIMPLLIPETGRAKRDRVWDQLEAAADRNGVRRMSYVFMAALCATATSPKFNAGRMIFKPGPDFDIADAHNAASDLFALELMNQVIAAFPDKWPVYLTHDQGLALLWCGFRTHSHVRDSALTTFRASFLHPLFDRLTPEQNARLAAMMNPPAP